MLAYVYIQILLTALLILKVTQRRKSIIGLDYVTIVLLIVFVGLRHKVGGDWGSYLLHFQLLDLSGFWENLISWDPGYVLIEYISKYLGLGIYGVNVICALLFFYGFVYFTRSFNINLSYALFIAFPYLIMVVVSGYSRQGVAVGFVMAMCGAFYRKDFGKSLLFYVLAVLFHKTALIACMMYVANRKYLKFKNILAIVTVCIVFYMLFKNQFYFFYEHYLKGRMQSTGGLIRILINVCAGSCLFLFRKRWKTVYNDYNIWKLFAVFSFLVLMFVILTGASTIGDRILLYFYPLQIAVFSRLPSLARLKSIKYFFFLSVMVIYWGVLLVWLNYAVHRFAWTPYNNLMFKVLE